MTEGTKYDEGKNRLDLIPVESLFEVGRVYTFGAKKYEDHNWRKGIAWSRIYGAIQRHLNAFWSGQDTDIESGLSHLAHATWGCLTLLWYAIYKKDFDDRWKNE